MWGGNWNSEFKIRILREKVGILTSMSNVGKSLNSDYSEGRKSQNSEIEKS